MNFRIRNKIFYLTALTILLQACSSSEDTSGPDQSTEQTTPSVEAVEARFGSLPLEERLSGIVTAANQVDIYPQITAPVEEVLVENGDKVEKGDLLLRLRSREYEDRLKAAQANLRINQARAKQAKASMDELSSQLNRQQKLAKEGLISELELEQIRSQYTSAEANYELALAQIEQAEATVSEQREALSQTEIRSPITGTVGQRTAEAGMQATTSVKLFTVGNLDDSRITINLTEKMMNYIEVGQSVRIYSENFPDTVITDEVDRISPFLESGSFSTTAEIDVPNDGRLLLPGMFVTVDVLYGESEQATLIPLSAIYKHPRTGETGVYLAPNFGLETEPVEQVNAENPPPLSSPTEVNFVSINVVAKGREAAGVTGIRSGQWVITVGQNLLVGNEQGQARIRAIAWNRILSLQRLQPDDLLREVMDDNLTRASGDSTVNQSL